MSSNAELIESTAAARADRGFFGHPWGLSTLFLTEMWERFSYYGMRAILLLYMTAELSKGGLGWEPKVAAPIYALYASSVYFLPIIGGLIADRFIGARYATFVGGIIIMTGHFLLAFPPLSFFYAGLIFVAIGTGFLKANISKMVGDLYSKTDERRDAGFSVFYMGINIGAFISPLVCGALAVYNWHWGFAAAGVGMGLGLIVNIIGWKTIKNVGQPPAKQSALDPVYHTQHGNESEPVSKIKSDFSPAYIIEMVILTLATAGAVYFFGTPLMPSVVVASLIAVVLTGVQDGLSADDWKRLGVIFILFSFSTVFWMGFEQAATSFNLFADKLTDNRIFGWEFPASWLQSVNAILIIIFAPIMSLVWLKLGKRQPSDSIKFVFALVLGGLGFVVVAYAASLTGLGKVSPLWLCLVYLFHTIGELCLSPVGLSSMTKLAPLKMVSLMLGVWFLSISLGNYVAGMIGGEFEPTADVLVGIFSKVAITMIGAGVVLAIISPLVKKLYTQPEDVVPVEPA